MCFLKNVDREVNYDVLFSKFDSSTDEINPFEPLADKICLEENIEKRELPYSTQNISGKEISVLLAKLSSHVSHNNHLIDSIFNKLQDPVVQFRPIQLIQTQSPQPLKPKDQLLHKLFGQFHPEIGHLDFPFKLSLEKALPKKLFKSKKLQFTVKLMSSCSKNTVVHNYNPLDICVGVFDNQGQWITENLLGEPILEGVTSVQLLNGKADFSKIYVREISSNLPNKKLNLAIYVKPGIKSSMGVSTSNSEIEWRDIKPVLVRNLTVLSKNRKSMYEES